MFEVLTQATVPHRFLFVINDGKVHAYNTASGELASCLEGSTPILAVSPEPANHRQLVTADAAGSLVLWDFLLGTSLKVSGLFSLTGLDPWFGYDLIIMIHIEVLK